jgi:hypothetical protein
VPSGSTTHTELATAPAESWTHRYSLWISLALYGLALLIIWVPGSTLSWGFSWTENPLRLTVSFVVTFPAFQWSSWFSKYASRRDAYDSFRRDVVWPLGEIALLFFAAAQILVFVVQRGYVSSGWDPGTVVALVIAAIVLLLEVARNASKLTTSETAVARSPVGVVELGRGKNFCTACGERRLQGQVYCGSCGSRLDAPSSDGGGTGVPTPAETAPGRP